VGKRWSPNKHPSNIIVFEFKMKIEIRQQISKTKARSLSLPSSLPPCKFKTRIMPLHLLVQNPNSPPLSLSQTQVKVFNTDTLLKEIKIGPKG